MALPAPAGQPASPDLTGRAGRPCLGRGRQRENITFKGIVGLELKARGLDVELAVYCDEDVSDTFAEIVAAVPGAGDDAQVRVTDGGGLTWMRDYQADPAAVAGSVVEAVTRAMSCLRRAGAGMAGHG